VRLGFVGAGAITRRHLDILAARSDVEVAAICDLDADRAQVTAGELKARVYVDWRTMLDEEGLDALFVCTPPESHARPTVEALGRGVHVYVEKPLARGLADGSAIVSAWRESTAVCAVGYQWRSLDLLATLRSTLGAATPGMLVSRSIGPTEGARSDLAQAGASGSSWFLDPRRSGGILFELGSHDVDLQLAIAGPAASVQATAGSGLLALAGVDTELHDAVALLMRFAGGGIGTAHIAWSDAGRPPVYRLDVLAPAVALHLELDPVLELRGRARGDEVAARASTGPRLSSVARFLDAVRARDPGAVPCSPADALDTLRVLVAAEEAIETAARVDVM
jgi:predicted dehydrogenase